MLVTGRGPTGARRALGHTWRADLLGRRPWPRPEPWEPREVSEKGAPEPSGQSSRGGWARRLVLGGATSLQKQPEPCGRGRRRGPVPAPHSTRAVLCWGSGPMQGLRCQTGLGSPPCSGPGRGLQTSAGDRQLPHPRGGRHQAKDSAQACTRPWEPTAGAQLGLMDVHRALPPLTLTHGLTLMLLGNNRGRARTGPAGREAVCRKRLPGLGEKRQVQWEGGRQVQRWR